MKYLYVFLYLVAIVAANLSLLAFGSAALAVNAFLFIGLDLTCRDRLHDLFAGHRVAGMGALITAGSLLSFIVAPGTGAIALASCVAFGLAALADAFVYYWRRHSPWIERANESNIAGAAVDSVVFPALAFPGPLAFAAVFGMFTAKVAGGAVWALALRERTKTKTYDLSTHAGALAAVRDGALSAHEAPMSVIRELATGMKPGA